MNAIAQFAAVIGLSLAAAGGTYLVKGAPERKLACDPATLKQDEICLEQVPEGVLWIDARPRAEWEKNGVPGSILWNLEASEDAQAFEAEAAAKIIENPNVVVYCSNENCGISRQVADKILNLNLDAEVKVLRGGWQALSDAGRVKGPTGSP